MEDKLQTERETKAEPLATNTLIITNVSYQCFENNGELIKKLLEPYGHLVKLIVLKSFGRLLAVFDDAFVSQTIKHELHKTRYEGVLNPNTREQLANQQVAITNIRKGNSGIFWNGSPPVGWLQTAESEPKAGGFCDTIEERALSFVSLSDFKLDGYEDVDLSRETARDRKILGIGSYFLNAENSELGSNSKIYKFEGTGVADLPVLQIDTVPDMFDTSFIMPTTTRPPIKDE
ncbi:hypothetical protein HDV06_005988 [Boothiomyces sp. JEL0866]|nr:hypothetical protein HDV06_005988 [Boothiomyces sp. JEL0866]